MINHHHLINLPGYGSAEKELRKAGLWLLTPNEKIEKLMRRLSDAVEDVNDAATDCEYAMKDLESAMEAK